MIDCALCSLAEHDYIPKVNPDTATLVPWSVYGDPRDFAFICDDCATDFPLLLELDRQAVEAYENEQR